MAGKAKRFRAVLEPLGDGAGVGGGVAAVRSGDGVEGDGAAAGEGGGGWGGVSDIAVWGSRLRESARREGYFLLVNKQMQRAAGAGVGATVEFAVAPDLEPREAELPDELAALLEEEPGLRAWYDGLTEYMRREIGKWVVGVKSEEARMRRAQQMAERLLATMEGERELPPVIAAAFRARPKARAGWAKMTPAQRRGELMAVFYYQTPEARQRRVEKLCDAAEKR